MSLIVRHAKVSTVPDGDDPSVVRPSDWNDDHVVEGAVPSDFQAPIMSGNYYSIPDGISGGVLLELQDVLMASPFWFSRDVSWSRIGILVDTPSDGAKVRVGLYACGASNLPGALIADLGEIDGSSVGYSEITIDQRMSANVLYWLACITNSNAVGIFGAYSGDLPWIVGYPDAAQALAGVVYNARTVTYGPLPDPFGLPEEFRVPPAFLLRTGV